MKTSFLGEDSGFGPTAASWRCVNTTTIIYLVIDTCRWLPVGSSARYVNLGEWVNFLHLSRFDVTRLSLLWVKTAVSLSHFCIHWADLLHKLPQSMQPKPLFPKKSTHPTSKAAVSVNPYGNGDKWSRRNSIRVYDTVGTVINTFSPSQ